MRNGKARMILVSSVDYDQLDALLRDETARKTTTRERIVALRLRLQRAQVLAPSEMPEDVVRMNSRVQLRDLGADETAVFSLVYPALASGRQRRISVLAPLGTAILGRRAGDLLTWETRIGSLRLELENVGFPREGIAI